MSVQIKGKIIKRKKQTAEFGVAKIDNTAPVQKIVDDLHNPSRRKHEKSYSFYCQTIRQRRTNKESQRGYHYSITGHSLNAFNEDWDGGVPSGYFEPFTYKCICPKMIMKIRNINKTDPVTDYMYAKQEWHRVAKNFRCSAVISNMLKKYESLNEDVVHCPKHLVDMAAHFDSDPDPYFDAPYNWYYLGNGNLQLVCVDWTDYILHAEFSTLYLSPFNQNKTEILFESTISFECEGNNIFETICSSQNIIAVRTMKKVYILRIVSKGDIISIETVKTMENDMAFTSVSFDKYHKNMLYVTSLDNKLTIVNLDRMKGRSVVLKNKIDSLVDNWSAVISSDRISYTHVARNCITFYDKRSNDPTYTWSSLREITDIYTCNDISVAKQCEQSTYLYFSTEHHLFLMDLRGVNKTKSNVVQRWTHGMQCMPTYMSICNFEYNKELICLSSQWCEDMCVIPSYTNRSPEIDISGVTIPFRPPSILNTFTEAKQKLLCLDLYNPVEKRLCTAITGSIVIEHGENYDILMLNSLGDITLHSIFPEHMDAFVINDSLELLHEWSKGYKVDKSNFEVSCVGDFKNILKNLKKVPEEHILGQDRLLTEDRLKFNEQEIFDAFENEEIEPGLLDLWVDSQDETLNSTVRNSTVAVEDLSSQLRLHYTDSE